MPKPTLQFWFEFASTYSYLSVARIAQVAAGAGVTVDWKPFLLGPIFHAQGWDDSPFNLYPAKGRYMWHDLARWCERYDLPFRHPSRFPRNGLHAARVACCGAGEPWLEDFVRAVFHANFAEDREISTEATLVEILDSLGLEGAAVFERSQAVEVKERLRAETDAAARLGIFGAPTFVADGELYWGNDRLEDAIAWLGRRV